MSALDSFGHPKPPARIRTIEQAAQECYAAYVASARKAGRNPRLPYVPVLKTPDAHVPGKTRESQIRARAFSTRDEAIACAEQHIECLRQHMRERLAEPRMRQIRAEWGVPDSVCNNPALAAKFAHHSPVTVREAAE